MNGLDMETEIPLRGRTTAVWLKTKLKHACCLELEPYPRSVLTQIGKPGLRKHLGKIDSREDLLLSSLLGCARLPLTSSA